MAKSSSRRDAFAAFANDVNRTLGGDFADIGSVVRSAPAIPTGSLALDYALGTGGWPRGCMVGVYGPRDIGKSSIVGLSVIRNAQAMGLGCALIAVEPGFDPVWAQRHGVDADEMVIARPDTGEKAFDALYKCVTSDIIDVVVFDSIGALLTETEVYGTKSGDAKAKQGGQAGLITWGVKRVINPIYMGQKTVIMLNQVRDNMASPYGGRQQPGGHAIEHSEDMIVELKRGQDKESVKIGQDEIQIMQEIVAVIHRNKRSEGYKRTARFNFYNTEIEGKPFGIDVGTDVFNTAIRLGVIKKAGGWYTFPGSDEKINGSKTVKERLLGDADLLASVRGAVLEELNG